MGIDSNRISNMIGHIVRHHLEAERYLKQDTAKFSYIDSQKFLEIIEKVAHIKERALDYSSEETQKKIDAFLSGKNPLLSFFQKMKIRFFSFFSHPQDAQMRYEKRAQEIVKYTDENFFGKFKESLSSDQLIGLFRKAVEQKNTKEMSALLEIQGLESQFVETLFPKGKIIEHPQSLFIAAASCGNKQIVKAFLSKQANLNIEQALQAAVKHEQPQIVGILVFQAKKRGKEIPFELLRDGFSVVLRGGNYKDALQDVILLKNSLKDLKPIHFAEFLQAVLEGQWPDQDNVIPAILPREDIGAIFIEACRGGKGKLIEKLFEQGQISEDSYRQALSAAVQENAIAAVLVLLSSSEMPSEAVIAAINEIDKANLSSEIQKIFDLYTKRP